jgi:peptidoglycan/LPS O-acetylase OafA/YrhL
MTTRIKSYSDTVMTKTQTPWPRRMQRVGLLLLAVVLAECALTIAQSAPAEQPELNDSHFHLTNYIQQGTDIHDFLSMMGTKVGRVALFGIPLQQMWSYQNSGDFAPNSR